MADLDLKVTKPELKYIIIACCTYKRMSLDKTISSLLNLTFPRDIKIEILIVDNDKNQTAKAIVEKFQKFSNIKIHYTVESKLGFANVRNAALNSAVKLNASHLLFIDDDEIAAEDWLINHIEFYRSNEAICVSSGPTYKKFTKTYPKYITNNNWFKRRSTKKLGQQRKCCATGNVLFPLNIVTEHGIYFSEDFNFLGSEDVDFFTRVNKSGFTIGWNSSAVNYELIDDDRANLRWLFDRCFNDGYSGSVVKFREEKNVFKRIFYIVEKVILIPLNVLISTLSLLCGFTVFFNCICLTVKNLGKLIGAIRMKPMHYYQKREVQGD